MHRQDPFLREAVDWFTAETDLLACMHVACGTGETLAEACSPNVNDRTLYDLASLTKLMTGLTLLRLRELGRVDLKRPITDYAPSFPLLCDVTVEQVLSFDVSLQTPQRVDTAPDREEGLRRLREIRNAGPAGRRPYSDMPAMILKYAVEGASGLPLYEAMRQLIFRPAGMTEIFARVPEDRLRDCVSYDREHRIENGRYTLRTGLKQGIPHDPKAALLSMGGEDLCGHAGLFATAADLVLFCRALLAGKIVSPATLEALAVNRTGRLLEDGTRSQCLGWQCYVKHPDPYFSEIPVYMGQKAFGIAGFTGNHLAVDPEQGIFEFFLGNRVLNRVTVLVPGEGENYASYGLAPDGQGTVRWPDGRSVRSTVNYVHQKDAHYHPYVAKALQSLSHL